MGKEITNSDFSWIDNGLSGEVQQRATIVNANTDSLASLENKFASLEKSDEGSGLDRKNQEKAIVDGREICMFYNNKGNS